MKIVKTVLILVVGLSLLGFIGYAVPRNIKENNVKLEDMNYRLVKQIHLPTEASGMYILEYEGHEYLYVVEFNRAGFTHSASCRYCQK